AMDGCDFELMPGEILAVIGDNGAGKSTLIKALSGAIIPDEGTILLDGEEVRFHGPLDARKQGIETVYQDLAVAPALTIAENLFLGREIRLPVILISHNMPHVFEVSDRIHIQRLGRRAALVETKAISMPDAVAIMTGARSGDLAAG